MSFLWALVSLVNIAVCDVGFLTDLLFSMWPSVLIGCF